MMENKKEIFRKFDEVQILTAAKNIEDHYNEGFEDEHHFTRKDIMEIILSKISSLETEFAILEEADHIENLQDVDLI